MITIKDAYIGHRLTFSNPGMGTRGFSVIVKDLAGVHTAIDHYYFQPHNEDACPLCEKPHLAGHGHPRIPATKST